MVKSFVLNLGRGIVLSYQTDEGAPIEYHTVNTEHDLVIRGFATGLYNDETGATQDAALYIYRADLLAFLSEAMGVETPAAELDFEGMSTDFNDCCRITITSGGVVS